MKNINLNFNLKTLPKQAKRSVAKLNRYTVFVFTIGILGLYGFLVFQIGAASQAEPSETAVAEKMGNAKRLKIDQQSIEKIEQLEDQNVAVQSLFKTARDNPFQDE